MKKMCACACESGSESEFYYYSFYLLSINIFSKTRINSSFDISSNEWFNDTGVNASVFKTSGELLGGMGS